MPPGGTLSSGDPISGRNKEGGHQEKSAVAVCHGVHVFQTVLRIDPIGGCRPLRPVREAREELDFNIITGQRLGLVNHKYSHFHVNIVLFKCSAKRGSHFPLRSSRLRWISYKEINRFAFPSATHKLFKLIKNDY